MENLKHDRLLAQESIRQISNGNVLLQQDVDEEKTIV